MEHRWGHRYALDLPVEAAQGRQTNQVQLRDISITGFRISTPAMVPLLSQLRLTVDLQGYRLHADAWVVRAAPGGYGLEWLEGDSIDVQALLEYAMRSGRHAHRPVAPGHRQAGYLRRA